MDCLKIEMARAIEGGHLMYSLDFAPTINRMKDLLTGREGQGAVNPSPRLITATIPIARRACAFPACA
jgi:hypothetical protein